MDDRTRVDQSLSRRLRALQTRLRQQGDHAEGKRLSDELQGLRKELEGWNRERSAAQEELEASRDGSTELYDFAPIGLATFDGHGTILEINLTGAAMLGRARARLQNCPFDAYLGADDRDAFPRHLQEVLASGQGRTLDIRVRHDSGGWHDMHLCSVRHETNGEKVCLSAFTDVSGQQRVERRPREPEPRMRNERLARVTPSSTVGKTADALADEMTQPLTAMDYLNDAARSMLQSGAIDPRELLRVHEDIDAQVQRASEVIGRWRRFMPHGNGQRCSVAIEDVLADAVEVTKYLAIHKQVQISVQSPEGAMHVLGDREQLAQVLVNLLCNSIEAIDRTGRQERRVQVQVEPGRESLQVTVRDTGPGLRHDSLECLFDISETDSTTGTGVGLAISRSIVEAHGGKLWADPDAVGGAVFHFALPIFGADSADE